MRMRADYKVQASGRTFAGAAENNKVKVIGLSEVISKNNLLLEVEDGDAGAVEGHPRLILLGLEFVKDGRCHEREKHNGFIRPLL